MAWQVQNRQIARKWLYAGVLNKQIPCPKNTWWGIVVGYYIGRYPDSCHTTKLNHFKISVYGVSNNRTGDHIGSLYSTGKSIVVCINTCRRENCMHSTNPSTIYKLYVPSPSHEGNDSLWIACKRWAWLHLLNPAREVGQTHRTWLQHM